MNVPEGWTDDMNISLPDGVTVVKIAEFVLSSADAGESHDARVSMLQSWGLGRDDAELACDRALGGAFRAGTTSPENEPSLEKDPVAHFSYHRCRSEPALIARLFPKEFSTAGLPSAKRPWWRFWG